MRLSCRGLVRALSVAEFRGTSGGDCVWAGSTSSVEGVWRPLDTSEALFAAFNAAGAFLTANALEVHGPLTETLLLQALAHVEKRHPLLRARIIPRGDSLYWAEGAATSPRISIVDRVPPGGIEALTEVELHRTYAATRERLWRCTWIPISRDHHWIVLALHHAVADGISSMVIVRDLLATCGALIGVGKLPPELPAGRTLDEMLPPVSRVALLRNRARRLRSRLLGPATHPSIRNAPPEKQRTGSSSAHCPVRSSQCSGYAEARHDDERVLAARWTRFARRSGPYPSYRSPSIGMRGTAIPANPGGLFATNIVTVHPRTGAILG
jgi:hypothetical protein